jgi:uncharacterized protein (DUF169 family)
MTSETGYRALSRTLVELLGLDTPPVGMAFVRERPEAVAAFDGDVPSACSFWRHAEDRVLYAPAEKHFNCPVGALTMGFNLPDQVNQELMGVVQKMCECGYLGADEPASMPAVKGEHRGVVYGPLADLPVDPDLVVIWLTPVQAMLANEAAGNASWSADPRLPVLGRPACGALPMALSSGRPALSLGCAGMRTFTEVGRERLLFVLPGRELERFVTGLQSTAAANAAMQEAYDQSKARFA